MKQRFVQLTGLLLLLAALGGAAQAQEKYTLRYQTQPDTWKENLVGDLVDVAMQGQSLGVKGNVTTVVSAKAEAATGGAVATVLTLDFSQVQSSLNGQPSNPAPPPTMLLTLIPNGQVTDFKSQGPAPLNFMDTGGMPIQILAMLSHVVRFSENAVAVDEEWTCEDTYDFPTLGQVPINTRWKLAEVKNQVAVILSTAAAVLPTFKAPNPMAPGTDMDIKNGRITMTDLKQRFDMKAGRLLSSDGNLRLEANVDMGGMLVPATLTMRFGMKPLDKPTEPPR
jgi:hypothetical protein